MKTQFRQSIDKTSRPSSSSSLYNQRDSSKISSPKNSHLSNSASSIHPPQVAVNQPPDTPSSAPSNAANPSSGSPPNHAQQAPRSLPPPPPGQSQRDTPSDYFAINHHSRLDQEPNVFEQSFASNSGTTPNDPLATPKAILPPVTAITSPASLLPGGHLNWGLNSLRSGPLSPAMLQGPASNSNGVGSSGPLGFDSHIRTGLTPNESGIRSGLTPGGSASIFNAPTSAMFQFVGTGGATPGTMEFHKTAIAAARKSQPPLNTSHQISIKPEESSSNLNNEHDQQKSRHSDPYHGSDPAHNAASGLFLLAQAQHQQGESATVGSSYQGGNQLSSGIPGSNGGSIENSSPSLAKRAVVNSANNAAMSGAVNRSVSGGSMANSVRGMSEMSDEFSDSGGEGEMQNPNTNSRNTRARKGKGSSSAAGRRKAEDQSPGGGRSQQNKKSKGNQGQSVSGGSDDGNDAMDMDDNQTGKDGKKMTDEEKRKNFLERNR